MVVDVHPSFYSLPLLYVCLCLRPPAGSGPLSKVSPGGEEVCSQISQPVVGRRLAAPRASASGKNGARYHRQPLLERWTRPSGENARRSRGAGGRGVEETGRVRFGHHFKILVNFLPVIDLILRNLREKNGSGKSGK